MTQDFGPNPHGWKLDPSVKKTSRTGPIPEGHLRRCRALIRKYNRQCGRWALKGGYYCKRHRGGAKVRAKRRHSMARNRYTQFMSKTLSEVLEGMATNGDPLNIMDLSDEIEIARADFAKTLRIWDIAHHGTKEDGTPASPELRARASYALRQACDFVTRTIERQSRIIANLSDRLPLSLLPYLVDTMETILREEIQDDALAAKICARLRDMKIPQVGKTGEGLATPEQTARQIREFLKEADFEDEDSSAST